MQYLSIIVVFVILDKRVDKPVFILGAGDPEMDRIDEILREQNQPHILATICGERVGPGNAYHADNQLATGSEIVFIECYVDGVTPSHVIDHHREGDPGYGIPAERYWEAASIGQLVTYLELADNYQDRVLAAMDHCFSAALRGECPGVDPKDVLNLRVKKMTESQGVTSDEVFALVEEYIDRIQRAKEVVIGGATVKDLREVDLGIGYSLENLSMGLAQALTDTPLLVVETNPGSDGRKKVTIDSGDEEQVRAFMSVWAPKAGLTEVYGVPSRGYAGAYISIK